MRIYRFYLTIGSVVTEVFPLNFLETSLVDGQEENHIFYRRKFEGSLTFVNNNGADDFDLLYLAECVDPCGKLLLEILRDGVYYWNGYFSTTDGNFDLDKCTFTVKPLPDDEYVLLLENAKLEWNIITELPSEVTIHADKLDIYVDVDYTHNRWLINVINFLADKLNPGINVSSTFFTAATNPVTLDDSFTTLLTIAQKSDIIDPAATEPATTAIITWNDLMDILWGMFQVTWDYDETTDTINLEHISWFNHVAGMDLRSQVLADSNDYFYDKDNMPKYEKFAFMEADDVNFIGKDIWYDSYCVNQDAQDNSREINIDVTTDLTYIQNYADYVSPDGWVIFCTYEKTPGSYHVKSNFGILDNAFKQNMDLSWARLHHCFYRHNRILMEGWMNEVLTTFWTVQKHIVQECYAVVCPSDNYHAEDLITTKLSDDYFGNIPASVRKSILKPSGEMKFEFGYGAADGDDSGGVPNGFYVNGYFSIQTVVDDFDTISILFNFNEPAPGDINIRIREFVYDWIPGLVYTGAWNNVTFLTGTINYDFEHTMEEGPLIAGYCMILEVEFTGTDIDNIYISPDPSDPSFSCVPPIIYTEL